MFRFILVSLQACLTAGCMNGAYMDDRSEQKVAGRASFSVVSASVLQVARNVCLERRPAIRARGCDFHIVRLEGRDMPANAWQTNDRSGRPMIVITEPLLATIQNDHELAFVIAHEAAHHAANHQSQALAGQVQALEQALGLMSPTPSGTRVDKVDPQEFEREADALGAQIVAKAGYDPRKAVGLFEHLPANNRFAKNLMTHPDPAERRRALLAIR